MPHHDFDFEFGRWTVHHRRLRHRLEGCTDWDDFTGTAEVRPILGGQGNLEDNVLNLPDGPLRAIALRSFDPATGLWAIWWLAASSPHHLDTPVIGGFRDGIGTFTAQDVLRGQPILVRFLWLDTQGPQPRWEQAFSPDSGATWETNWTMRFTRA